MLNEDVNVNTLKGVEDRFRTFEVDGELYTSANDLFTDIALIWYRGNKKKAQDWKSLCHLLREEFQLKNYNEKLFKQIKERTQHPDEPMGIYIAFMNNHFERLTVKIPKSTCLRILLDNMAPFYKIGLALHIKNIISVDQLPEIVGELEANRSAVNEYLPPPTKSKNILEPDLACVYSTPDIYDIDEISSTRKIECFRCHNFDHMAAN
ncbi:hypothetical protein FQA39_LY15903 [Lamprigera yunnana]|nr:hypothetical protein FQA39_LY15903 [Lamprigera yunnana]